MGPTTKFSKIQIINIKPLIIHGPDLNKTSVRDCIHSMHVACRDVGFLGLTGHNISREIRQDTLELSRQFFALQTAEKNKIHISKYNNAIGYQYFGENITQNKRDKHEGIDYYKYTNNTMHEPFNIDNIPWPEYPSTFASIFNEYIAECLKFGEIIMSGLALSLRLPHNYFYDKCNESFYILRILHYPTQHNDNKNEEEYGEYGCGEHRDYGCLTLINCDNTMDCLEVKDANGVFGKVNVNAMDEDCFIVNLGDMLNVWSGGLYQSTPHRILSPIYKNICNESIEFNKQNNSEIGRISIPFFYEPNWETIIKPIEIDMEESNINAMEWNVEDKIKWKQMKEFRDSVKPIMYGDHLKSKVFSNFY